MAEKFAFIVLLFSAAVVMSTGKLIRLITDVNQWLALFTPCTLTVFHLLYMLHIIYVIHVLLLSSSPRHFWET